MDIAVAQKIEVKPEHWDNVFAPSSCLVMITTTDEQGRVNAAAYGTCTRVCHDPVLKVGLPFKAEYNELEMVGLTSILSTVVRPPRIVECRSHFEMTVAWTHEWENRLMVVGKVVAVSIDEGCLDAEGFIYWDKVKPAHYCGGRYQDQFVPVNEPLRIDWDWTDLQRRGIGPEHFRPTTAGLGTPQPASMDWRNRFRSRPRT